MKGAGAAKQERPDLCQDLQAGIHLLTCSQQAWRSCRPSHRSPARLGLLELWEGIFLRLAFQQGWPWIPRGSQGGFWNP